MLFWAVLVGLDRLPGRNPQWAHHRVPRCFLKPDLRDMTSAGESGQSNQPIPQCIGISASPLYFLAVEPNLFRVRKIFVHEPTLVAIVRRVILVTIESTFLFRVDNLFTQSQQTCSKRSMLEQTLMVFANNR